MLKKIFASALLLTGFAAASFADTYAGIDLNYWCRGELKLLTEQLPDGVTVSARKNYSKPQFSHICYYKINVNLNKVQEFELQFEVVSVDEGKKTAKLVPSVSPFRDPKDGKKAVAECLEFECCDEASTVVPGTFAKWTSLFPSGCMVSPGEKFTVKGKFKAPTE
jgi:hypothetical protein